MHAMAPYSSSILRVRQDCYRAPMRNSGWKSPHGCSTGGDSSTWSWSSRWQPASAWLPCGSVCAGWAALGPGRPASRTPAPTASNSSDASFLLRLSLLCCRERASFEARVCFFSVYVESLGCTQRLFDSDHRGHWSLSGATWLVIECVLKTAVESVYI